MKNTLKTKYKAFIVGIAFMLTSSFSFAGQWTGFYPVYEVYTHSGGYVFLRLNPIAAHVNPSGCNSSSHMRMKMDQGNAKEIYQMALTAQAAGLKVSAYTTGCSGNYVDVQYLRVRK